MKRAGIGQRRKWLLALASSCLLYLGLHTPSDAQQCHGAKLSRETAPGGALLHNANAKGNKVWTVACKGPNAPPSWSNKSPPRLDKICEQISACPAAGGFGKFLQAVTFDCKSKQFDGYFGLDGMTYGILDWTGDNLPRTIELYQRRSKDKFAEIFGKLNLPIKNGCLDPSWVCNNNKQGNLTCDASFHSAFALSLKTPDFQKAQVDYALSQYEARLARFKDLGLKTKYGNTAMAVVANNLVSKAACRPASWKAKCAGKPDETAVVRCMLEEYAENACRGSLDGSRNRKKAINAVFANATPSENIHPTAEAIVACSDKWGTSSN
jgi:hypothetical protein